MLCPIGYKKQIWMSLDQMNTRMRAYGLPVRQLLVMYVLPQNDLVSYFHHLANLQDDSGSGLLQYYEYESNTRAFLIGILSQTERSIYSSKCEEGLRYETTFVSVAKHMDWIKEVIRNTTGNDYEE